MKRLFAILLLLISSTLAAEQPSADQLRAQAAQCRQILKTSLVEFYLPNCLDQKKWWLHGEP